MSNDEDAELLQVFLEEAREHLGGIEGDLLELETTGAPDRDLVNKVFRAVHSVKGGAGFFGLESIKTLSHAMENVLGQVRDRSNRRQARHAPCPVVRPQLPNFAILRRT